MKYLDHNVSQVEVEKEQESKSGKSLVSTCCRVAQSGNDHCSAQTMYFLDHTSMFNISLKAATAVLLGTTSLQAR